LTFALNIASVAVVSFDIILMFEKADWVTRRLRKHLQLFWRWVGFRRQPCFVYLI
jgi:hypothetical protein